MRNSPELKIETALTQHASFTFYALYQCIVLQLVLCLVKIKSCVSYIAIYRLQRFSGMFLGVQVNWIKKISIDALNFIRCSVYCQLYTL